MPHQNSCGIFFFRQHLSQKDILGHLMWVTGEIARQLDIEDAYRVVVNNGAKAGQSVFHLHLHILSGRVFSWPPG